MKGAQVWKQLLHPLGPSLSDLKLWELVGWLGVAVDM